MSGWLWPQPAGGLTTLSTARLVFTIKDTQPTALGAPAPVADWPNKGIILRRAVLGQTEAARHAVLCAARRSYSFSGGIPMKYGARNTVAGEVKSVQKGDIMSLVKFDVAPCEMASVLTTESLDEMDLRVGDKVSLVVKAVNVLPVKE